MEKYQLKDNKGLEFIQLGEIGIEDERIFSLMDQPVRKDRGVLVDFFLLLAAVQFPTLIGAVRGSVSIFTDLESVYLGTT